MNKNNMNLEVLSYFLPIDTLKWFDIVEGSKDDTLIKLVLEEKNIPPIPMKYNNEKITSKGFKEITISDYPIRGRKTLLTFKRRYWQIDGQKKLLKNDIKLVAEGTLLEKEFADFLKE
jgi:hypothetical protein